MSLNAVPDPELGAHRPSSRDRAREREAKKDAVLIAAVRLFNDKGFRATSLDDVARALNVTKPTIYHYFDSKEDVLVACVELGLDWLRDAVARGAGQPGTARDRLEALLTLYAVALTRDFGICVIRTDDREISPEIALRIRAVKREIDAVMREVIEQGVAEGSLKVKDVRLCAFALASALNGIARWYDPNGPDSAERIAKVTVSQLTVGLTQA